MRTIPRRARTSWSSRATSLHAARLRDALHERDERLAEVPVEVLGEGGGHHVHEVIVTLGFAADGASRAPAHLGALTQEWGRESLVQALSSASHDVTVFTTLGVASLEGIGGEDATGVEDLRELLRAAQAAPVAPERPEPAPSDWLLADVAQRLRRDGYGVHVRYGTGADAIPMVVGGRHDRDYTVAVVTDEATAAGSVSLRDRIRRQRTGLERLGWRVVPLWTLDVFMDPDAAAAQVLAALPENATEPEQVQESLDLGLPEPEQALPLPDLTAPEPQAPAEPEPLTIGLSTLAVADAVASAGVSATSDGKGDDPVVESLREAQQPEESAAGEPDDQDAAAPSDAATPEEGSGVNFGSNTGVNFGSNTGGGDAGIGWPSVLSPAARGGGRTPPYPHQGMGGLR
ncbi:hypothetical protein GCM10025876_12900 [Demequina litorisediminis]|uniref:Restriction endonuclease type II-like domain-containing protein n=1 Tax=Demequina litorisediminis TaxID=1849022 RepID=A0ABQ6ICU6_9MICO|nr:hypothetical protein GCM10025876_12900 [Demequina litorisediminis]